MNKCLLLKKTYFSASTMINFNIIKTEIDFFTAIFSSTDRAHNKPKITSCNL